MLWSTFGQARKVSRGLRVPESYPPIQVCLGQSTVFMRRDDPNLDRELEDSIGAESFAAAEVGDGEYILAFDLREPENRDDILFSLGLLRHGINDRLRQERIDDVLRQARKIQASILPRVQPEFGDFDIAGVSQPLETVGGDFINYLPLTDKILGLAIADVSGHGLPAALQVRDIYMGLRMGMARDFKIVRTVERLNSIIHQSTLTSRFVSMFYGELEIDGTLIYVNAGHPPPFHLRADGEVRFLEEGGTILGPLPEATYTRGYLTVRPGDLIVAYTDGIIETSCEPASSNSYSEYGVERVVEVARVNQHRSAGEKFVERVWQWKEQSGGQIANQLRRLGGSVDWSRDRFTMDEGLSNAVTQVFVQLYEEGLIYRGKRLVNWDPVLHTALSDLEVLSADEAGSLWHFRYPLASGDGHLVVATTRPETMLGDSAVAVHPEDDRYRDIVGQEIVLPIVGRRIPIIADDYVDPEFGTGCVKITPAHDFNDYEIGKRHDLAIYNVLTDDAAMNDEVPEAYRGLDRFEARQKIVAEFESLDLLEKIEDYTVKIPRGDRSHAVVEPYLTDQWYVDIKPLADPAIAAVENGDIRFVPENWSKTYFDWMYNIQDWCISRQLWWGTPHSRLVRRGRQYLRRRLGSGVARKTPP